MEKKDRSIELRSEKVRNIIGQIPPVLIRSGTLIICVVLLVLLAISAFIPYRETISIQVKIGASPEACYIRSPEDGFFVSDSIPVAIDAGAIIGYIICKDSIEKIISPVKGEFLMNVRNMESLSKGTLLCAVISKEQACFGFAEVSTDNYHKIREGNKIVMALSRDKMVEGIIEKVYPLSDNQNSHTVKIAFDERALPDRQAIGTVYNGKVILRDTPVLKKFVSSIGFD